MKFLAIPTVQLSDSVSDIETARQQAEELIDKHGKQLGSVTVIAFYERGVVEYCRPIWFDPAPQSEADAPAQRTMERPDLPGQDAAINGEPSARR